MARMRAESSFVSQTLVTSAIPAFSVLAEELKKILLGTDNAVAGISRASGLQRLQSVGIAIRTAAFGQFC